MAAYAWWKTLEWHLQSMLLIRTYGMWWHPQFAVNMRRSCTVLTLAACVSACGFIWLWLETVFAHGAFFCMFVCNSGGTSCVCFCWGGGGVNTQMHMHAPPHTGVGNILMLRAKQEIGNAFKSLALRTGFRSQTKSPHNPGIACDRVHHGIVLYPLRA